MRPSFLLLITAIGCGASAFAVFLHAMLRPRYVNYWDEQEAEERAVRFITALLITGIMALAAFTGFAISGQ